MQNFFVHSVLVLVNSNTAFDSPQYNTKRHKWNSLQITLGVYHGSGIASDASKSPFEQSSKWETPDHIVGPFFDRLLPSHYTHW